MDIIMQLIIASLALLGILGFIGAVLLYFIGRKFEVVEDSRIEEIANLLPGANCGGCGYKGCRDFASTCVSKSDLSGMFCPVGGADCMEKIAGVLGVTADKSDSKIAVLLCNGTCSARSQRYSYDGVKNCRVMDAVAAGTQGCAYGCLGCGDCVSVCMFGALTIDETTGLPITDTSKCTGCGACVEECPRKIIELRPAGRRDRRVYVACSSHDKGALARKICANACIGCSKCVAACSFGAVEVNDNLAYLNPELCKTCGKCVNVCPTGAIKATFEINNPNVNRTCQ